MDFIATATHSAPGSAITSHLPEPVHGGLEVSDRRGHMILWTITVAMTVGMSHPCSLRGEEMAF